MAHQSVHRISNSAARAVRREMQENQFAMPGFGNQSRPVSDPQRQATNSLLSFNHVGCRIVMGCITDVVGTANCYRVHLENGLSPRVARLSAHSNLGASGPRDHTTLQPGQVVFCILHPHEDFATILCTVPGITYSSKQSGATQMLFASRQRVDEAHKAAFDLEDKGSIVNFNAGRPLDMTFAGQVGWTTERGLAFFLDSAMFGLMVNESTGVFGFRRNGKLRIAGTNLQLWTSVSEMERFNDQEECLSWEGHCVYPWEQQGKIGPGEAAFEKKEAQEWQIDKPHLGKVEPKDEKAAPWHRVRHFYGYLGQGWKTTVQIKPKDAQDSDTTSYGGGKGLEEAHFPAVADDQTMLNGDRRILTATRFSIRKHMAGISPQRVQRPEQGGGKGDDETNYKFSGTKGSGPEHKLSEIEVTDQENPILQQLAGWLDQHAYENNYASLLPFIMHAKDYFVPDESKLEHTKGATMKVPDFAKLKDEFNLEPPEPIEMDVDQRQKMQKFFQVLSRFDITPDGSVVFNCGYGASMTFSQGHVTVACPGDYNVHAARDINLWAGHDLNMRAFNSADLTSTKKDVRIKAEANLHMLAGNGGMGGVHLESRADDPTFDFSKPGEDTRSSGITFRAPNSGITGWSQNVYLRTGSDGGTVQDGPIVFDAAQGKESITTHSSGISHYTDGPVEIFYGTEGKVRAGHVLAENQVAISSPLNVVGQMVAVGGLVLRGSVTVTEGHIATEQAQGNNCKVNPLEGLPLTRAIQIVAAVETTGKTTIPARGKQEYQEKLQEPIYEAEKPGNAQVIGDAQFSLRTVEQYGTEKFVMAEDHWQQLDRLSGGSSPKWEEKPVEFQGQDTYPYPGRENYEQDKFHQQDLSLWEFRGKEGSATSRGTAESISSQYLTPKYKEPTKVKLSQYSVIRGE